MGATGLVGQVFVKLLDNHPYFRLKVVTGGKSAGHLYGKYVEWRIWGDMPQYVRDMEIRETSVDAVKDVDLIFSALPSSVARVIEPKLLDKGLAVISNSSAMRMEPHVPLVVPEVNPMHLSIIIDKLGDGFIVANPNCSTIILSLFLKPIYDAFGIEFVHVVTMQSLSGAGYPGNSAIDMVDNLIPYIEGEEAKLRRETKKIFGVLDNNVYKPADFDVYAQANRVNVRFGHTESVLVKLSNETSLDEVIGILSRFRGAPQDMNLPTAPDAPIYLVDGARPQPRFDAFREGGMAISVGRLSLYDGRYLSAVIHGNNLVRGAAGGTILIGEYLVKYMERV